MSKILVIDDDVTVRKICAGVLKRKGYRVLTASGGEDGLKILKETVIKIVVLDLTMPRVTGLEVLKEIRELSKKVFVIILTGTEITEDIKKLMDDSTYIMSKGDGMASLLAKIDEIIEK
ncbi:MAG: response regulator [Elusimicrobiales bacterium]|nr:response regulator [Elusimicrobiales bacterium]MCK5357426.1 response regulator [Elusimicrobiales bacterium]